MTDTRKIRIKDKKRNKADMLIEIYYPWYKINMHKTQGQVEAISTLTIDIQ